MQTMKINQSIFIKDLIIEKNLNNCNANVVPIKTGFSININDADIYKKKNLYIFQQSIKKLIYLIYDTKPDIAFAIRQLSKHNVDLRRSYLQAAKRVVQYYYKPRSNIW